MSVRLVTYIPNQLIVGSLVYIMQGYGQFYHTQAGRKMATMHTHYINNKLPKFLANLIQLLPGNFFKIVGVVNLS